jgi:hypothetical protein
VAGLPLDVVASLPHKSGLAVNAAERGDQPWMNLASTSTRGKVETADLPGKGRKIPRPKLLLSATHR